MTTYPDLLDFSALMAAIETGNCRIVDCRFDLFDADKGRSDYLSGHIPGAVYAHLDDDLASEITPTSGRHPLPEPERFAEQLRAWGIDNDTFVVAYDYGNGSLAARLWWMLKYWLRHERVAVMEGGPDAWVAAGESLETSVPAHARGSFDAVPDPSVIVTTGEIAAAAPGIHLVDARDSARFRGEVEPIDPVAGHVPGARNLPLTVSLDENGRWRSREELRQTWETFLAEGPGTPPVAMCGSGVTACHLVLSAVQAGLPAPRVYVGSWSEWIRDPSRPIVWSATELSLAQPKGAGLR